MKFFPVFVFVFVFVCVFVFVFVLDVADTLPGSYGLYGLEHHIVEISGNVTDAGRTDEQTNKGR